MRGSFNIKVVSPCSTPTSSRRPEWMSRNITTNRNSRITSYFPIRKRGRMDSPDVCGKRRRRGTTVSDVEFLSPEGTFQGATPLRFQCSDKQDEQQAGDGDKDVVERIVHSSSALGIFEELPSTLFRPMFDSIDIPCLVALCLSSSTWNAHVLDYVNSNLFLRRVHRESSSFATSHSNTKEYLFTILDPFYCFGKLLKSVSVCFPTSKRISLLMSFCDRALAYDGIDKCGVGRVIHTMCSKWAFSECEKVLQAVLQRDNGRLQDLLKQFSSSEPESLPKIEMELRETVHALLLSGRNARYDGADTEYIFWVSAVLRTVKEPVTQSRLLMVLYGPLRKIGNEKVIDWRLFCEHIIAPFALTEALLKPLSDVLHLLLNTKQLDAEKYLWSQHDVFNVIEELTTSPEPWSFDNFVSLLLHRTALIPVSLVARMNHNYSDEACLMFLSFIVTSYRWNMNVCEVIQQPLLQTMRSLTRERGREFYNSICDHYANMLKRLSSRGEGMHKIQM
ncbi:hypothetical protein GCK32_005451 [Trichostrongylus colubriformis]|uniref:FBXO47 ARM repeats region domain-containing protein n=1 Tax=Trichostrongylus colubriformis TaxID=6319 RepID=A0AAN8J2N9_TRICO